METTNYNGIITVSDIIDGEYVKRRYIGYTTAQAKADFRREVLAR